MVVETKLLKKEEVNANKKKKKTNWVAKSKLKQGVPRWPSKSKMALNGFNGSVAGAIYSVALLFTIWPRNITGGKVLEKCEKRA